MPEKWERCVKEVKAKQGKKVNAYAVCTASTGLTREGNKTKKSMGDEMDQLKSLGIHVGQPTLIVQTQDTVAPMIEKGFAKGENGRIGFAGNAADRLTATLTQNDNVAKSMRQYIGKSEYSKGDDNGDNYGAANIKDTHGEQFHDDKIVTRKEVDNDRAEEVDSVHGADEEENPKVREGKRDESPRYTNQKKKINKEKETTSGDGLVKRSLTQEELFLKALGDLNGEDLLKSDCDDDHMEDLKKKKKCMAPMKSEKEPWIGKGPIKEFVDEEAKEKEHSKGAIKKLRQFDKEEGGEEAHKSSSDFMDDLFGKSLFPKKAEPIAYEPYKPTPDQQRSSLAMQFKWKVKELEELKNCSWFMERELDDAAKEVAEKMYARIKNEINALVKKYHDIGKSYAEVDEAMEELRKGYMGFKKLAAETSPGVAAYVGRKKYGKKKFQEAAAQGKKMNKSETEAVLDSLIEMVEDRNDPETIANIHENSNDLGRVENPNPHYKSMPFVKSAGPGGVVFDFGPMTGNPVADKATVLLSRHADPTQMQIAKDQQRAYNHSLNNFVKSGHTEEEAGVSAGVHEGWQKSMSMPMDKQVEEAFKSGALDNKTSPSTPAVKNDFNKTELQLGGEVIKATSPTDAALIEMMKAEMASQNQPGMIIADARYGGAESVTVDARTGSVA